VFGRKTRRIFKPVSMWQETLLDVPMGVSFFDAAERIESGATE
jgi:hypothetical protein